MKEIILLKSGEIALKGLNRSTFEDIMAKNARRRLQPLGEFKIWHAQSTTYVQPLTEGVDMDEAVRRLQTVFGIVAVTKSCVVEKDFRSSAPPPPNTLPNSLPLPAALRWRPSAAINPSR